MNRNSDKILNISVSSKFLNSPLQTIGRLYSTMSPLSIECA